MHQWRFVGFVGLAAVLGAPGSADGKAGSYVGSAAEAAAAKAGWRTLRTVRADVAGDGQLEDIVVQAGGPGKLRLLVLSRRGTAGFRELYRETLEPAARVERLDIRPVAGDAQADVVAVFEDPSPDERAVAVRVVGSVRGRVVAMFAGEFLTGASTQQDPFVFGDASPGFALVDRDKDGVFEVAWTAEPQRIDVEGRDGPVRFTVGVRRQIHRFDGRAGRFQLADEEVVDFLPPRPPRQVEATRQVPKIWGTAQAFWGADGDLETSWSVPYASPSGEALTVRWRDRPRVSLIRVVPGCGATPEAWRRYGVVRTFAIQLSTGLRFQVRADGRGPWPSGVRGLGVFPLEGGFGRQVLIFLDSPAELEWARLEIVAAGRAKGRRGRPSEVCLSEISFH